MTGTSWRLWDGFDRIEITLGGRERRTDEHRRSLLELDQLLRRLPNHQPDVSRTLLELYSCLRGLPVRALDDVVAASTMRRELVHAARSGALTLRRETLRSVAFVGDLGEDSALGPDETTKHIYKVCVLDDTGAPVAGAKLNLNIAGDKQDKTTDGSGKVTIEKTVSDTATVVLTNLDDLRDRLWPQWSKPQAVEPPKGDEIIQVPVGQPFAPQKVPSDWGDAPASVENVT